MPIPLQFAAVGDHDFRFGSTRVIAIALDLLDDVHSLGDRAEDDMLAIEPGRFRRADEELRAVGVGAGIGHAHNTRARMLERKIFIGELFAVDGLTPRSVVSGEIAALTHELRDNAVERTTLVAETLFAGAQRAKVFRSLGHHVRT